MNLFINIVNCFVSFFFFSTDDCYNTVICMIIKRNKVFIFAYKFLNKEKLIKTYVFNNRNPVNTSSKFYLTDDQYSIIIFFYWFVVCMFIMVMVFGNFSEFNYQVFEFLYIFFALHKILNSKQNLVFYRSSQRVSWQWVNKFLYMHISPLDKRDGQVFIYGNLNLTPQ